MNYEIIENRLEFIVLSTFLVDRQNLNENENRVYH